MANVDSLLTTVGAIAAGITSIINFIQGRQANKKLDVADQNRALIHQSLSYQIEKK